MAEKTVLKGNSAGGFLDSLINKNELPTVKITIEKETLIQLGLVIVISMIIVFLAQNIMKSIFLK